MIVKLKTNYAGPRATRYAGEPIDLPESEAKELISAGFAEGNAVSPKIETAAIAPAVETAAIQPKRTAKLRA